MFLVLIGTLACFLLLAIGSYSPDDPSFTYTGGNTSIDNLVGVSGAYLADILLFLFGWVAYLLPMGLIYGALRLLRTRGEKPSWLVLAFGPADGSLRFCVHACSCICTILAARRCPRGPEECSARHLVRTVLKFLVQ